MTGWRNISGEISVSVFGRLVFWLALTQLSFGFLWLPPSVWPLGIAGRTRRGHPSQGLLDG